MIQLAETQEQKDRVLRICEKTAFGCKIASVALAYGFDKSFSNFWVDMDYEVTFCMVDGLMLIAGTVISIPETKAFLRAVGGSAVMCAVRNAEALGLVQLQSGDILRKTIVPCCATLPEPSGVNIREIYGLLEETGMVKEFEPFYLDLSHKLRHQAAVAATRREGESLAGVALVSSVAGESAIISVVAVATPYRRQGIGSALMGELERLLPCSKLYLFREKEGQKEFYRQLDYKKVDTWVCGKL